MADLVKKKSTSTKKTGAKPRKATTAKKSAAAKTTNGHNPALSHEQVAKLAHRFWTERGRLDGHHEEDWFRAEQELRRMAS